MVKKCGGDGDGSSGIDLKEDILCFVSHCKGVLLVNCITLIRSVSLPSCNLVLPLNPGKNRSSVENTTSPAEDEKER